MSIIVLTSVHLELDNLSANVFKFCRKVIFEDVFVTAPKINVILFNQTDTESPENESIFTNLFHVEMVQPSISFSNENGYRGIQV